MARAKASANPVSTAGSRDGRTILVSVPNRLAPSVAEASSDSRSISAIMGCTVRTANGSPMKTSAMKMPTGVNAILMPTRSNNEPIGPLGA